MFYAYVLASLVTKKLYVGHAENIYNALAEHNKGYSKSTSPFRPWKLIYSEKFETKSKAKRREEYLKTRVGRKWLSEEILKNN